MSYRGLVATALAVAALAGAVAPTSAAAQGPPAVGVPALGQFRSVLAQGEGQSITASDFAQYQSTGQPPDSFVSQQPLYVGITPQAGSLTPSDLNTYYKDTNFGSMPGGTAAVETPHPGVHIYRDGAYGDGNGNKLSNGLCPPGVVPVYGTPRTVAGDAITTDANKCQLMPLKRSDYTLPFTNAEWATMKKTFPLGVCDFSKPAVDQGPTIPWLTYQNSHGHVIYGGRPLGKAPRSRRF